MISSDHDLPPKKYHPADLAIQIGGRKFLNQRDGACVLNLVTRHLDLADLYLGTVDVLYIGSD